MIEPGKITSEIQKMATKSRNFITIKNIEGIGSGFFAIPVISASPIYKKIWLLITPSIKKVKNNISLRPTIRTSALKFKAENKRYLK